MARCFAVGRGLMHEPPSNLRLRGSYAVGCPVGVRLRRWGHGTLDPAQPTTLTVSPATAQLAALGATVQLSAEVRDQNGQVMAAATLTWASSAASVATVSSTGLVTAVADGAATITATAGDARGTAEITVQHPDRAALVALYNATDGPNWLDSENWLTDAPLAEWYGIDTDASGRVVRIALSGVWDDDIRQYVGHGLSGIIPPELGASRSCRH